MPALPPYLLEPIWRQFETLLPHQHAYGVGVDLVLLGEHASSQARRVDRAGGYGSTQADLSGGLRPLIGLEFSDVAVDCCITKAPCGGEKSGRSPVDRGKRGLKRSMAVDSEGIPLGAVSAPANRHDSPLLVPTLKDGRP